MRRAPIICALALLAGCSDDDAGGITGAVNRPPIVTAPATLSVTTGEQVTWTVIVDDPDGDAIIDIQFSGAVDEGGGLAPGQSPHLESVFKWQGCKPGTYEAVIWASSGSPAKYDTARTEITVTGEPADHYVDFLGGTDHFEPDTVTIQAGETVAWRSMDGQPHSVTDISLGQWHSSWIKPGCISTNLTFTAYINPPQARTYQYRCINSYHSSPQVGVIIVNP